MFTALILASKIGAGGTVALSSHAWALDTCCVDSPTRIVFPNFVSYMRYAYSMQDDMRFLLIFRQYVVLHLPACQSHARLRNMFDVKASH